jgi:hypothetical protein
LKPLNIYSYIPVDHTASSYYRIQVVAQTALELGLPVRFMIDRNLEGIKVEDRIRTFCEADLVVLYQPIGDGTLSNVRTAKSFLPGKREGDWKYPPTFILDTDDNLFRVDPHNPAFATLGVRDPETGQEIPKGFSISEVRDGVRKLLWKDGLKGADGSVPFDVERNRASIETYVQLVNQADCITTTTLLCAEPLSEYCTPRKIQVAPNLVRFNDYPQLDIVKDTRRINILWQGGQNHFGDWITLKQQVANITERYPEVHWITWGVDYKEVTEVVPPHRLTFMPWCAYPEYKLRRVMVNEDINLAPLAPTPFNRCRSAIKWYEASVSKNPAPTLAQATGPYLEEIQDSETGLLYNTPQEFEDKLAILIENSDERKRLASNAKDWINDHRDARKHVPSLIRFYEEMREATPIEHPHMPEDQWEAFEASMLAQAKQQQPSENGAPQPEFQAA